MFIINDFIIFFSGESELVVQTDNSILKLTDSKMISLIKKMDKLSKVSREFIKKIMLDETNDAIDWLIDNRLIKDRIGFNFNVKKIFFISNSKVIYNGFKDYSVDQSNMEAHFFEGNNIDLSVFEIENTLYIVHLNPYSTDLVKKIHGILNKRQNSYMLLSYVYNFKLYMDNLYIKAWNNPDHFDHIGHIESSTRTSEDMLTYQDLIDMIYRDSPEFMIEMPLKYTDILQTLHLILSKMEDLFELDTSYIQYSDQLIETWCIDYSSRRIIKDTALFWEFRGIYDD